MKMTRLLFENMVSLWNGALAARFADGDTYKYRAIVADFNNDGGETFVGLTMDAIHAAMNPDGPSTDDVRLFNEPGFSGVLSLLPQDASTYVLLGDLDANLSVFGFALIDVETSAVLATQKIPTQVSLRGVSNIAFLPHPRFYFPSSMVG